MFVFKPNEPRPFCIQRNVCRETIQWAVFIPRDVPESIGSEKHQWLSRSQLYFLTGTQVRSDRQGRGNKRTVALKLSC